MGDVFLNSRLVPKAQEAVDPLLVYFHAQRTGGSKFRHILGDVYGPERVYATQFIDEFEHWEKLSEADLAPYRAFAGHSNYKDIGIRSRRCLYVGLLRHPVARAISLYFYCQTKEGHALQELANTLDMYSFYIEASELKPKYMENVQCLRLCGKPDADAAISIVEKEYLALGSAEDLPSFVSVLGSVLGWPGVDVARIPPDRERYEGLWTRSFEQLVVAGNQEDLKLYEYARSRYFSDKGKGRPDERGVIGGRLREVARKGRDWLGR